eukprot:495019-Amphidinium_carterae.1
MSAGKVQPHTTVIRGERRRVKVPRQHAPQGSLAEKFLAQWVHPRPSARKKILPSARSRSTQCVLLHFGTAQPRTTVIRSEHRRVKVPRQHANTPWVHSRQSTTKKYCLVLVGLQQVPTVLTQSDPPPPRCCHHFWQ